MFPQGRLLCFEECRVEFGVPESERFRYIQLRHWLLHPPNREAATSDFTPFEQWIQQAVGSTGLTSGLYKFFLADNSPTSDKFRAKWEELTGLSISEPQFLKVWRDLYSSVHSAVGPLGCWCGAPGYSSHCIELPIPGRQGHFVELLGGGQGYHCIFLEDDDGAPLSPLDLSAVASDGHGEADG